MALDFPAPAGQTPVNTFSPTSTPSATTNNLTYSYDGEKWVLNGSGAFVAVAGDTMTGNLGLPGGGGPAQALQSQEISSLIAAKAAGSLQAVTDVGSTTTNGIDIGSGNIALNADGSAVFAQGGGTTKVYASGHLEVNTTATNLTTPIISASSTTAGGEAFRVNLDGLTYVHNDLILGGTLPAAPNISLNADGKANFSDVVNIGSWGSATPPFSARLGGTNNFKFRSNLSTAADKIVDFHNNGSTASEVVASISAGGTGAYLGGLTVGGNDATQYTGYWAPDSTLQIGGTLPASPNISLNADGRGTYEKGVDVGGSWPAVNTSRLENATCVFNGNDNTVLTIFNKYPATNPQPQTKLNADGSASFGDTVTIGGTLQVNSATLSPTISLNATNGSIATVGEVFAENQFRTQNGYGVADNAVYGIVILNAAGTATAGWLYDGSLDIGGGIPGSPNIRLNVNGSATYAGTITQNASDSKFKDNVADAPSQSADIKALQLRTWDWNDTAPGTESRKARHTMGLVAQEAALVDADITYTANEDAEDTDKQFQAIDHDVLTMKLVGALQEALTEIDDLKARLDAAGV